MQQYNPQGTTAGAIGALLGSGIGNVASGRGFFETNNSALQKVTKLQKLQSDAMQEGAGDPVKTLETLSARLIEDPELAPLAMQVQEQLLKIRPKARDPKLTSVAPGSSVIDEQGNVLFTAPDRPAKDTNPTTASERDYLTSLQSKYPDTAEGKAAAANEFAQWKSSFRQREAAAGVPGAGEVKVTDIASATGIVDRFVKDPKDRLSTANSARTQLNLAKQGSGPAFAQLKRQLVKLVGDSQIGQGEVRDALGRAGIVGDTIDAVNTFLTGVPSRDKLGAVEQVINALEEQGALSYNEGRAQAERVLNNAKLTPSTVKDLIPPPYKTAREKAVESQNKGPAVGAVQSGYRFKGGDPANKNNWEKVQ
jgi:hypothetical protein